MGKEDSTFEKELHKNIKNTHTKYRLHLILKDVSINNIEKLVIWVSVS